jgi:hypothetical protein
MEGYRASLLIRRRSVRISHVLESLSSPATRTAFLKKGCSSSAAAPGLATRSDLRRRRGKGSHLRRINAP